MPKTTSELLFAIISYAVFGKKIPEELYVEIKGDLHEIYKLAKRHDLGHLLFDPLSKCGIIAKGDEGYSELERQKHLAVFRMVKMSSELSNVSTLLSNAGIKHIPLKGSVIRSLYPEPYMRTSCDIDILVHKEDIEKASFILVNEGKYVPYSGTSHDVSFDSANGVHLELHFELVEEGRAAIASKVLSSVWDNVILSEGSCYKMSDELFYFYHLAHMAKHFEFGGFGIRPCIDLLILDSAATESEKDLRDRILEEGGLLLFAQNMQMLAKTWFLGEPYTPLIREVESCILIGGAYGTDKTNAAAIQAKQGGRFKTILLLIFMPYKNLKILYPSLEGRKWLTPFYWVRRWFRVIFRGRLGKAVKTIKTNVSVDSESRNETAELFSKLGL